MPGRLSELERKLLEANMGRHTRFWGVIDEGTGTFVIKGTCRDCGDHGEFKTQQEADAFKGHHDGPNNVCPHKKDVVW